MYVLSSSRVMKKPDSDSGKPLVVAPTNSGTSVRSFPAWSKRLRSTSVTSISVDMALVASFVVVGVVVAVQDGAKHLLDQAQLRVRSEKVVERLALCRQVLRLVLERRRACEEGVRELL